MVATLDWNPCVVMCVCVCKYRLHLVTISQCARIVMLQAVILEDIANNKQMGSNIDKEAVLVGMF